MVENNFDFTNKSHKLHFFDKTYNFTA